MDYNRMIGMHVAAAATYACPWKFISQVSCLFPLSKFQIRE